MRGNTIYVLGELNPDIIMTGQDLVPEFNREKLLTSFRIVLGSSSAITAVNLAGLGANVRFVSVVGDDPLGHFCLDELRKSGVDTRYVTVDHRLNTGVTLSFSTAADRALMTHPGAIPFLNPAQIPAEMYEEASHIHFGSYYLLENMRSHWMGIFGQAAAKGIRTSFDTGWDLNGSWERDAISDLLKVTDWFIPSEDELLQIYEADSLEEAVGKLPEERGSIVVKRGAKGAAMIGVNGSMLEIKAFPVAPIDTTGAGDSFNAGLIYGLADGRGRMESLRLACACGALATLRIGGAGDVPPIEEVEKFIQHHA